MNELLNKKKQLNEEINCLGDIIYATMKYTNENEKYYTKKESIEALKNLKYQIEIKQKEQEVKIKEYKKLTKKIQQLCNHELAINGKCVICENPFIEKPVFNINLPYDYNKYNYENYINFSDNSTKKTIKNIINEILTKAFDSDNFLLSIESSLEDLQDKTNIKIRRLK